MLLLAETRVQYITFNSVDNITGQSYLPTIEQNKKRICRQRGRKISIAYLHPEYSERYAFLSFSLLNALVGPSFLQSHLSRFSQRSRFS